MSYLVSYRDAGRQKSLTFDERKTADYWAEMIDRVGAKRALDLMAAELAADENTPTITELVTQHIASLTGVEPGTRESYRRELARDITPYMGDLPATALGPDRGGRDLVAGWVNMLAEGVAADGDARKPLAGKTIRNRHALLSAAAQRAVEAGYVASNPCHGMRLPTTLRKSDMYLLTAADIGTLLRHLDARWHLLMLLLVGTGLRWGEATALRKLDVQLNADGGVVHVTRAWKETRGTMQIGPPKSKAGVRSVPVPASLVELLRPHLAGRAPDDLVFTSPRGHVLRGPTWHSRVWPAVTEAALTDEVHPLMRKPRMHDLRHTAASRWLLAGVPIHVVQRLLGHESITTTVDLYGHIEAASAIEAAARMDAWLTEIPRPEQ